MLQKYIEGRERFFHGRNDNRTCLPFEWGIEHLGLQPNGNFETPLQDFVSRVLLDSSSFYAHTPTQQYEFDGSLLRFPSEIKTPYPENNTVWGRVFAGTSDFAVIVLPQWNCKWEGQITLCRVLQIAGITALRLSLPYQRWDVSRSMLWRDTELCDSW